MLFPDKQGCYFIDQGHLGDCWFLSAMAALAKNPEYLAQVIPTGQSFSKKSYCGMFVFRFWQAGSWQEVIIDDRLPTIDGDLIYCWSKLRNVFWCSLLEKAYAKWKSNEISKGKIGYKSLEIGLGLEAFVDFSGGIPEQINLENTKLTPDEIFRTLMVAYEHGSFMDCNTVKTKRKLSDGAKLGLIWNHSYTITKVFEFRSKDSSRHIRLMCLRSPHGNSQWCGHWSDNDANWKDLKELCKDGGRRERKILSLHETGKLVCSKDGEFCMRFDTDFLKYFDNIGLCRLCPQPFQTSNDLTISQPRVINMKGCWDKSNAGGCGNDSMKNFAKNPQIFFNLRDPDPFDDQNRCPVTVCLTQVIQDRTKPFSVGFDIYKCNNNAELLDEEFFQHHEPAFGSNELIASRDVSQTVRLTKGRYCIIPYTFKKNQRTSFLIRVLIEKPWRWLNFLMK